MKGRGGDEPHKVVYSVKIFYTFVCSQQDWVLDWILTFQINLVFFHFFFTLTNPNWPNTKEDIKACRGKKEESKLRCVHVMYILKYASVILYTYITQTLTASAKMAGQVMWILKHLPICLAYFQVLLEV